MLFGLKLRERILIITDHLSMTLHKGSMSAAEAQGISKLTVDTSKGMRNDDAFKLFFQLVETTHVKLIQKKNNSTKKA